MTEQFFKWTANLKAVENGVGNKFGWQWLEEKDCNGHYPADYVRKLKTVLGVVPFFVTKD